MPINYELMARQREIRRAREAEEEAARKTLEKLL